MSTSVQLTAGADALRDLIKRVCDKADADIEDSLDDDDCPDLMDYRAMVKMVETALAANFVCAGGDHREGFLRALTDLLLFAWDGSAPGDDWDPIGRTHAAFAAPVLMCAAIDAAR